MSETDRQNTYRLASTGDWAMTCWDAGHRGPCLEFDTPEHLDWVQREAMAGESFVDQDENLLSGAEFLAFVDPLEWSFGEVAAPTVPRVADSLAPFKREQPVVCPHCHFEGYVTAAVHPDSVTFECPDCGQTVTYDEIADIPAILEVVASERGDKRSATLGDSCVKCGAVDSLVWAGEQAQCVTCGAVDYLEEIIEVEAARPELETPALAPRTAVKTAEVLRCATNWTLDGLPIEGGFAVEGTEEEEVVDLAEEVAPVEAAFVAPGTPLVWPDTYPSTLYGICPECHERSSFAPLELEDSEFFRCSGCGKDVPYDRLTTYPLAKRKTPGEFTTTITALADADLLEAGEMIRQQMGGLAEGERASLHQALGEVAVEVDRRRLPVATLEDGSWVDIQRPFCAMAPKKGMVGGPFPTFRTAIHHRTADSVAVPVDMASQFVLAVSEYAVGQEVSVVNPDTQGVVAGPGAPAQAHITETPSYAVGDRIPVVWVKLTPSFRPGMPYDLASYPYDWIHLVEGD
jgi:Zn ribbon nucleic-acid-binding protein